MQRLMRLNVALASLAFAACVTINVYFPAAAAEKAADQIIDTVTRSTSGGASGSATVAPPASTAPAAAPASPTPPRSDARPRSQPGTAERLMRVAGRALELLVPAAHAQASANLDISSPEIRAVTASMQSRFAQLEKYFSSGVLGLTADGLIEVRDQGAVALAERAVVKRLVAEDNKDRNTLYTEIARANGHAEWEADIRKIFSRRWVERGAQTGWYYQDAGGGWKQK
jgi:uncharacterized protein YdbL (DUF1318 family)